MRPAWEHRGSSPLLGPTKAATEIFIYFFKQRLFLLRDAETLPDCRKINSEHQLRFQDPGRRGSCVLKECR